MIPVILNKISGLTHNKNSSGNCLSVETIKKIILQFLNKTSMSEQTLAESLGITVRELSQLSSKKTKQASADKINLSLIKLYCKTKWL